MPSCAVCPAKAVHQHHVVYVQHVRKHGGDPNDPRNLMPLCVKCHGAHHGRSRVIPYVLIPEPAHHFAEELMGDYGDDYLLRYYGSPQRSFPAGEDRHTVTVDAAAAHAGTMHRDPLTGLYL